MKKAKRFLIIPSLVICLLTWIACEKEWSSKLLQIQTSKNELKTGDSIGVMIQNQLSGSVIKWNVQPSTGVTMDSLYSTGQNILYFSQAGTYTIYADMRTIHPDCRPSPSWDTCFNRAPAGQNINRTILVKN